MLQWIKNFLVTRFFKIAAVKGTIFLAAVFCLLSLLSPSATLAQSVADQNSTLNQGMQVIETPLGLPTTDIRLIVANIIKVALGFLGIIALVLMIYAGFLWMTSGGNEEQTGKAKKIIINAAIGLALILSAYAIVLFVMRLLGVGAGGMGTGENLGPPGAQNFQGSGALGGVIRDHYPSRDQVDVPRNTKIVVTFRKAVKPDSFIQDTNGNGIFGDCVNMGANMDWKKDCDSLILDNDHINIKRADNGGPIAGAAALVSYENGKAFTVVFRPYDYLGSSTDKIPYAVRLGKAILLDDPANVNPSAFSVKILGNDYYEWKFTCDVVLDTTAPYVLSVFPADGSSEAKNTVIQVDFSEAMDPIGIQGKFIADTDNGYYYLEGGNIFLKSGNSTIPLGNFRLVNGYRTLEFTSTMECGKNACGNKIFCLPVCDQAGATCRQDQYELLLKAGTAFNANAFEAVPFSGLMDLCGNALDGNKNGKVDVASKVMPVFGNQEMPDNFFWSFNLRDEIDLTPPYLRQVQPGLDAAYVKPNADVKMTFSKRMRVEPMYSLRIEEYPPKVPPLWFVPSVWFNNDNTTLATLGHGPFLDTIRMYYLPVITSEVEDAHFNCFYPGKGPGGEAEVTKQAPVSSVCGDDGLNCCAVSGSDSTKSFCCNGLVDPARPDVQKCLDYVKSVSLP